LNLKEKKLIIFDLDGTLIDSGDDLAFALNAMLHDLGCEPFCDSTIHHWVGNGAAMLVRRALSGGVSINAELDEALFEKALGIFLKHYETNVCVKTQCYEGVNATIDRLYKRHHTLAIVTNKPFAFVTPILKKLGLEDYFALILGGDSLSEKKPSPAPLLHVCEKLGFTRAETLMVGDSKNDILAANAADIESVAVSYGYNYGEDIASYKPTATVHNFGELLKL